ncbi:MAG: S26 family signal peptidase [Methanomassiliicoccales archaeon]
MEGSKSETKEALLSVLIVVVAVLIVFGGLYAYTGNWPPMVVVESGSMQHSSTYAYLGDLNIGDVVLVKKVQSVSSIITYVKGEENGYSSYGEFGNVIIYHPYGLQNVVPIIHRAILYLQYNTSGGGFNAPVLSSLPQSQWYVLSPTGRTHVTTNIVSNIVIENVGYTHTPVVIPITLFLHSDRYSGFVTMGDHNHAEYGENATDQALGISSLVKFAWIEGVATGYLPYVGIFRLAISGNIPAGTPENTIVGALLIAAVIVVVPIVADVLYKRRKRGSGRNKTT